AQPAHIESKVLTNQFGVVGGTAKFTIEATGAMPLTYLWRRTNSLIAVTTNASLVLSNLTLPQGGLYWIQATNALGYSGNVPSVLTILDLHVNGAATLGIGGNMLQTNYVEFTTNLVNSVWTSLTNIYLQTSPFHVIDYSATNAPQRFYR